MSIRIKNISIDKSITDNYATMRSVFERSGIKVRKNTLQSDNFVSGSAGWQINADGSIQASDLTLIGGTIKHNKTAFTDTVNAGYHISSAGFYFGSANDASYIKYNISTGAFDFVGNVSGRASSVLASSINASGDLITNLINSNLNTSAKTILKDFTFGSSDYSGAFKTGDITWNAATGAITGGSGAVFHKGGLIFASAGVATITLNGETGSAIFAGTLSATGGTLGTITAGDITGVTITGSTITGGTIRTSTSGERIELSATGDDLILYNSSDVDVLRLNDTGGNIMGIFPRDTTTSAIICQVDADVATTVTNLVNFSILSATATADTLNLRNQGKGQALYIIQTSATIVEPVVEIVSTNSNLAAPTFFIDRNGSGYGVKIDLDGDDGNNTVCIHMAANNSGAPGSSEYAFKFDGAEYDGTKTSVSGLTGVIKVLTDADGLVYIPVYDTAS